MTLAAKCIPEQNLLSDVYDAGLKAVELYLPNNFLRNLADVSKICLRYKLRYAVHAVNDGSGIKELAEFVRQINGEIVVFHNIYWEDEWLRIIDLFNGCSARLCLENTHSSLEPLKFIRRYGISRCLDLEHLQVECAGVFEDVFISLIKESSHIHLTGYSYGSQLWHTHIHHSLDHSRYLLNLIANSGYRGLIVSEAQKNYQTKGEFKRLREFYDDWQQSYASDTAREISNRRDR